MWIGKIVAICLLAIGSHAWCAVDINTASPADLESIKGIGPSTAAKIVTARKVARFKDWPDVIQRISGIGSVRASKLSSQGLTVNSQRYKGSTSSAATGIEPGTTSKRVTQRPLSPTLQCAAL